MKLRTSSPAPTSSTNEIASPSAAIAISKYPYARSGESGFAAYRRSDHAPAAQLPAPSPSMKTATTTDAE